jgi:alpha-galactosidase
MTSTYIRLKGLEPGSLYKDESSGCIYPADALMETGMPLPMPKEEYAAFTFHLIKES